jgi:hypothetical protein
MDWDAHTQKLWQHKPTGIIAFMVVIQGPKVRTMANIETMVCQNVTAAKFEAEWERYYLEEE